MPMQRLEKSQYQPYCDRVSHELGQHVVEVEVTGLGIRPPSQLEWTPLRHIAYHPDKDAFQIVTDDLDHLIPEPQQLSIDAAEDGLHSIQIIDAGGHRRTLRLRRPLPLSQQRH